MRFISRFKPYDMHHLRFKMLINLVSLFKRYYERPMEHCPFLMAFHTSFFASSFSTSSPSIPPFFTLALSPFLYSYPYLLSYNFPYPFTTTPHTFFFSLYYPSSLSFPLPSFISSLPLLLPLPSLTSPLVPPSLHYPTSPLSLSYLPLLKVNRSDASRNRTSHFAWVRKEVCVRLGNPVEPIPGTCQGRL